MELREYQNNCVNAIQEMEIGEKKIVHIATGGGKTIIMAELARRTNGRMLVLKLAFAEGVDKGKKDQKEYILNIIADRA